MGIIRTAKTSQNDTYCRRHQLSKIAILSICASVTALSNYIKGYYIKTPRNDSKLSGSEWNHEILNGHGGRFRSAFGLSKHVFNRLLQILQSKAGLKDSKHLSVEEQLGIFLYIATTGLSIQKAQERIQRSVDTIHK